MAGDFFTGWKLWEQLTFCLACGLVVAIGIGLLKLTYTSWRLRKYSALEKLARRTSILREKSIIRSLSRKPKRPPKKQNRADSVQKPVQHREVFFGIKALEQGAIVEGVWTSNKHSLASNKPETKVYARLPEIEAQAVTDPPPNARTTIPETIPAVPPLPPIDAKSRGAQSSVPQSRAYPPHSFMRYDSDDFKSSASRTSSRNNKTHESSRPARGTSSAAPRQESDRASLHGSVMDSSSARLPVSRDSSTNSIQLIDAHRASLCAETGQILPRFRSTSVSHTSDGREVEINDDEPTLVNDVTSGDISDAALYAIPSGSSQNGVERHVAPAVGAQMAEAPATPARAATHRQPSSMSTGNIPDPSVLRQVNSGFAILRPGTLNVADRSVVEAAHSSSRSRSTSSTRGRDWRRSLERRLSISTGSGRRPRRSDSWS